MPLRPKIPNKIQISNVPLRSSASGQGGVYATEDAKVTVVIEGDASGVFQVLEVETDDVVRDPDPPPGHPPLLTLEVALVVDGPGPIQVFSDQAILATVQFSCPADPPQSKFLATAVMDGPGLTTPIRVPIMATANLGTIEGFTLFTQPIMPGGTQKYGFQLRSSMGHDVVVAVRYNAGFEKHFSASTVFARVPAGGSVNSSVILACQPGTPPRVYDIILQILSEDLTEDFSSIEFAVEVIAPPPPPPDPGVDQGINWILATRGGIQIGENVFHSGRAMDMLVTKTRETVVAAESGGVWLVDGTGESVSVSDDWDEPDLWCLTQGPNGPQHVYAGGTGLYQTIPAAFFPLLTWRRISLLDGIGNVQRMVTLDRLQRIVLATDTGVYWAPILDVPTDSPPVIVYNFKSAEGLVDPKASYLGLALGPNDTVVVASWRKEVTDRPVTIYFGGWIGDRLVFQEATLNLGLERLAMFATVLASSVSDPFRLYAVSSASDGFISVGLRSDDGGQTWHAMPIALDGSLDKFRDAAGNQGNDYPPNICLAVSPANRDIVVIAWRGERLFVSTDAGQNWQVAEGAPHMHSDVRRIYFDPTDNDGRTVFTATDGGVMVTRNLGGSFQSDFNRQLPTMQFLGTRLTANERFSGLIAGATQDNGNLICQAEDQTASWQLADEGDGVLTAFIASGRLLRCNNTEQIGGIEVGNRVREAPWLPQDHQLEPGPGRVIPIDGSTDGLANSEVSVFVEGIRTPRFTNSFGELLHAIGIHESFVYGAFGEPGAFLWRLLKIVDIARDDFLSTVGSRFGTLAFLGSNQGRMFVLGTRTSSIQELSVENPEPDKTGSVTKIVALDEARAYAIYNASRGYVLQFTGLGWLPLGANPEVPRGLGLPDERLTALEVDGSTFPPTLFVACDRHAYISRDGGDTWKFATKGLPANAHCRDLRLAEEPTGARFLYLGTYGRSVWKASL